MAATLEIYKNGAEHNLMMQYWSGYNIAISRKIKIHSKISESAVPEYIMSSI